MLVVDDEPDVAELYANMLEDDYTVRIATSGEAALEEISDRIDVVLLDRRMPGLSGDEVLKIIRNEGYDCMVAMITAIEPDLDLLDLPFDTYLVKPIYRQDLLDVVNNLLTRSQYDDDVQELFRVISKLVVLESELEDEKISANEEYQALCTRREELITTNDERIAQLLDDAGSDFAFQDLETTEYLS